MRRSFQWLLMLGTLVCAVSVRAEQINIAVASNFTAPMREITELFNARTGHQVRLSFGSSGRFFAQISNGAPFAMFFSADADKPEKLVKQGLAKGDTVFTYAVGRLVLWSANEVLIVDGEKTLSSGGYRKLALANPELAPYGKAAIEFLSQAGLLEGSRARWVQGQNIAQVYQFVFSGNAEYGLLAYSQVINRKSEDFRLGSGWLVPSTMHNPIMQNAVILNSGQSSVAAYQLAEFMKTNEVVEIIREYGYESGCQSGCGNRNNE